MTHGQKVACKETLKIDVTFDKLAPLVKVTVFTGNLENINFLTIFDNISDIIHSRVMILDQR